MNNYPSIDNVKSLDQFIKNSTDKPTLLVHACCGPCSSYVLEYLDKHFNITIYYANSNMDTYDEYEKRYCELVKVVDKIDKKIKIIKKEYKTSDYYEAVKGYEELPEGSMRCYSCYYFRLRETAQYAKEHSYDYFTTTLSISPYKNSNWINTIGQELSEEYEVHFLFSNFKLKGGYQRSIQLSKEWQLYRQDYCGCKYSKIEAIKRHQI